MEGLNLYNLVIGQIYNAELRNKLSQFGLRRIGNNQWISKETASKYELLFVEKDDEKVVAGVDLIEKDQHIHLDNAGPAVVENAIAERTPIAQFDTETVMNFQHHQQIADFYVDLIGYWNDQIQMGSQLGQQLSHVAQCEQISFDQCMFLPNPMATSFYLFCTIKEGKSASEQAWLEMPDGCFIVPADGTEEGAFESLQCGIEFHKWEKKQFDTAAAAGQYAIKMLNASKTLYAQSIKKMLGKESASITRNDFYRNSSGEMCRIEVIMTPQGLRFDEVPVEPTLADCIDSLLAPYVKSIALDSQR